MLCLSGLVEAQTPGRAWPTERPPQPLAARDIKFPPYQIQTLPNGLQVVVVMHHEQPSVSMRLLVRVGTASDPKDQMGMAHLTASLLDQGTTTRSAQEMNDDVDFIGGVMGAGAGSDLTFVQMIVMKDSFEKGMRMLSDMARHPAFSPAEIDRQRQQTMSGLQVSLEDPEYIANSVFDRLVYGFHPYGMPDTGTPESIARLTRADLAGVSLALFHSEQRHPRDRRRRHGRGKLRGREEDLRRLGKARPGAGQVHRAAGAHAARRRRQQAGRGADRNPRRSSRHPAHPSRTTWP